jgi:hypothetical protein
MFDGLFGMGSYAPGSPDEWNNWDAAAFDRLSNEGIAGSSMSDSLFGQDWDYWGDMFGGQGASERGQMHLDRGMKAPALKLADPMATLSDLMNVATPRQQYQAGGAPWRQQYVTSLIDV